MPSRPGSPVRRLSVACSRFCFMPVFRYADIGYPENSRGSQPLNANTRHECRVFKFLFRKSRFAGAVNCSLTNISRTIVSPCQEIFCFWVQAPTLDFTALELSCFPSRHLHVRRKAPSATCRATFSRAWRRSNERDSPTFSPPVLSASAKSSTFSSHQRKR